MILHSALILLFMFTLWNRWFLTDIPFDCFYAPFFLTSGPLVYSIAHGVQHWSEQFFSTGASVFLPWDIVPGIVCFILGGIEWWCIGRFWLWFRASRSRRTLLYGAKV